MSEDKEIGKRGRGDRPRGDEAIFLYDAAPVEAAWRYRGQEMFSAEAEVLLIHLASEYDGPWWRRLWSRWVYHHEPLRNDAARLIRRYGIIGMVQRGTRLVGDPTND